MDEKSTLSVAMLSAYLNCSEQELSTWIYAKSEYVKCEKLLSAAENMIRFFKGPNCLHVFWVKFSAGDILKYFSYSQETEWKNKKNIINVSSAEFSRTVVKFKNLNVVIDKTHKIEYMWQGEEK